MTQTELSEILERHRKWLAGEAGVQRADLGDADLLDCSLPLGCGGLHITLSRWQMTQLIYQFCNLNCDDPEVLEVQKSMYALANEFAEGRSDVMNRKFPEA